MTGTQRFSLPAGRSFSKILGKPLRMFVEESISVMLLKIVLQDFHFNLLKLTNSLLFFSIAQSKYFTTHLNQCLTYLFPPPLVCGASHFLS